MTLLLLLGCAAGADPDSPASGDDTAAPVDSGDPTPTDTATSTGECPEGDVWDAGRCVPEACGRGTWGDLPADEAAAWVDASAAAGGDGSRSRPFTTLAEALALRGEAIFLAEGTYAEPFSIGGGLRVGGRCADLVTIDAAGAANTVEVVGEAWVHGLRLEGSTEVGVAVRDGGALTLDGVRVRGGMGVGVLVDGHDARLVATDLDVADTFADPERGGGIGLSIQSGAVATVTGAVFDENQQRGIYVRGFPSTLTLTDVIVRHTRPYENTTYGSGGDDSEPGAYGHGLSVEAGGALFGSGITLDGNTEAGIWAAGAETLVHVEDTLVTETQDSERYGVGMGVVAFDAASVVFTGTVSITQGPGLVADRGGFLDIGAGTLVEGADFAGLVVADASATLVDTTIRQVARSASIGGGALIRAMGEDIPPTLTLDGVVAEGATEGVYLTGDGAYVIRGGSITGNAQGYGVFAGDEVAPWDGTRGLWIDGVSVAAWSAGVVLNDSSATLTDVAWRDNGYDLVQTNCDDTPEVEGDGQFGTTQICADDVWIVNIPKWITLE